MTCEHKNMEDAPGGRRCLDCNTTFSPLIIPPMAPSGTLLEHTGSGSNWVKAHELPRVIHAMSRHTMAQSDNAAVFQDFRLKYVNINVDMRNGNFTIADQHGERIDGDDRLMRALGIQ